MKPIEINSVARSRPLGAEAQRTVSSAPAAPTPAAAPASRPETEMVSRSASLSAGSNPPVDTDRVTQIRNALKDGTYPLVPASVADAMIASRFILIEGKKDS
ncbi:flagellar biosynthesis anti-sigma factor FlgM [Aurantiacibacter xanthus]|uniref:Negative regulator of flagellin synthesis n=1 Tax=Aurantiacibacter xanthus TaxID=1784712 RepID=A0A3A1P4D5_9SPHN|nr:flagellar biosynthesis anti-sigma factor FlgM [Aurantiacibacter xanthus]RIV81356.1 flagellar biosynthesis anti-sigma factor FlgM [Aurantiacibacter xanthus]